MNYEIELLIAQCVALAECVGIIALIILEVRHNQ
jgi:hypothetical protein